MCESFFQVNVRFLETLDIEQFETDKVKTRASYGGDGIQYNASDINRIMNETTYKTQMDAVSVVAITNQDIYSSNKFNFVFGLASGRCGVFSFHRFTPEFNGDDVRDEQDNYSLVLVRACMVLCHELGHLFGIKHCIFYECLMNPLKIYQ